MCVDCLKLHDPAQDENHRSGKGAPGGPGPQPGDPAAAADCEDFGRRRVVTSGERVPAAGQ
eukprot:5916552-Lingulodinium_polyedra.AAC.1